MHDGQRWREQRHRCSPTDRPRIWTWTGGDALQRRFKGSLAAHARSSSDGTSTADIPRKKQLLSARIRASSAHLASATASDGADIQRNVQLVDELRDLLTRSSVPVDVLWQTYAKVARWRRSLVLLEKADFRAMLATLRGNSVHAVSLDDYELDVSERSVHDNSSGHGHSRQDQMLVRRITRVVRDMRLMQKRLPTHEYASLIVVCGQCQQPAAVERIFQQCREDMAPAPPSPGVYTAMMSACLRLQCWPRVVALFEELIDARWMPTRGQCNMTLRAYIEQGDYTRALALFQSMQQGALPATLLQPTPTAIAPDLPADTLTPKTTVPAVSPSYTADIATYNTWIAADVAAGQWQRAAERYERMVQAGSPRANKRTLLLLLRIYAHSSNQTGFMRVWHELAQLEGGIDVRACRSALKLLEHHMSPVDAVNALFEQMPIVDEHDARPSGGQSLARHMMLYALTRERRPSSTTSTATAAMHDHRAEFLRLYSDLLDTPHERVTSALAHSVMRGLLKYRASPHDMGRFLQWIDAHRLDLSATQWLWLLAYLKRSPSMHDSDSDGQHRARPDTGASLPDHLQWLAWDQPVLRHRTLGYHRMLAAILADPAPSAAAAAAVMTERPLLAAMQQDGYTIDPTTLALLANGPTTDPGIVHQLWDAASRSAASTTAWPAFIAAFARHGEVAMARSLFGQLRAMTADRHRLPTRLYLQLMLAYHRLGSVASVRQIYRLLWRDGHRPSVKAATILADARARFSRPVPVHQVLQQLDAQQLMPDLPLFTVLLRSSLRHGNMAATHYLLRQMQQRQLEPDARLATTLLAGYSRLRGEQGVEAALHMLHRLHSAANTAGAGADTTIAPLTTLQWNAILSGVVARHDPTLSMSDRVLDAMLRSTGKQPSTAAAALAVRPKHEDHAQPAHATTPMAAMLTDLQMPAPSVRTFKIVMGAHARHKRWWAVIRWWRRWQAYLAQGAPASSVADEHARPDAIAYQMIIHALRSVGHHMEAKRLVSYATKQGLFPKKEP
ncbi:hypothetical protein SYNPS1DRAFT_26759 [Syncephalis pseudoplumigaleata]|uniref:Pentacotripeptide-repeat region of PRORP domain-containing protein n=1 Tax=Syncephalis pseudoplumigaleata TaxID=1712513 RepID=A0A4P9Z4S5_9FUNG|nr:hypothetical protein SYNPS1DRAFT_26759 [Syncephalis pseudoplumigaleata]|eukprot:RKP27594.1 hypothetical protein SYNPS1DRAFT_26759 [Syncephalis pseudoplumigaleata]